MYETLKNSEAFELVQTHLTNQMLVKHSLAVEAGMRAFARHLGEDEERWALAGLLHDLDYEATKNDFPRHGLVTGDILRNLSFSDEEILSAIHEHSGNIPQETRMGQALYSVDPATGLVVAATLMHPSKKIVAMDSKYLMNRFAEKRFAQGANREQIRAIEARFGMTVEEFLTIVHYGMMEIASQLGL